MNFKDQEILVLMSGGMDSTTTLLWAIKNFKKAYAITFFYNQKHSKEIEIAKEISKELNVSQKIIDLTFLKDIAISNLFIGTDDVKLNHPLKNDIPSSFVPYRNLLFLTIASIWASTINIKNIALGVCETDYSGYADCRDVFIKSAQVCLNLSTDFKEKNVILHTPLMWLKKAQIFKLAKDLGGLDIVLKKTLTCYNGVEKINDFGMGCGECPSCLLRKKGYDEFRNLD